MLQLHLVAGGRRADERDVRAEGLLSTFDLQALVDALERDEAVHTVRIQQL